jgi:DNA-directed RNA polymerase specialized sigma24 family protein
MQLLARHLKPTEHEAVVLRYFECLPVDEITQVLGITQASGARGVLQSAKRKLRAAFADQGGSEDD